MKLRSRLLNYIYNITKKSFYNIESKRILGYILFGIVKILIFLYLLLYMII